MNHTAQKSLHNTLDILNSILKQKARIFSFHKPYDQKFVRTINLLSNFYLSPVNRCFTDTNEPFTLIHPDLYLLSKINHEYFGDIYTHPRINFSISDSYLINAYLAFLLTRFSDSNHKKRVRQFKRLTKQREEALNKKWQTMYRHYDDVNIIEIKQEITKNLTEDINRYNQINENHSHKPNDLLGLIEVERNKLINQIKSSFKKLEIKYLLFYWVLSADIEYALSLHLCLVVELPDMPNIEERLEEEINKILCNMRCQSSLNSFYSKPRLNHFFLNHKINGKYTDRKTISNHIKEFISQDEVVRANPYYFTKHDPSKNNLNNAIKILGNSEINKKIITRKTKVNNKSFFGIG